MYSAAPASTSARGLHIADWSRRNAHVVIATAVYACAVVVGLSNEFVQDTWLSITGGRDIARHGLPWHERLTVLKHGAPWIDQQWLGKLTLYAATAVGGFRLLALLHVALLVCAFAGAMLVARRSGASDRATFWVAAATIPAAPWAWQLRVQSLAYVLFVAVLALLVADARARSRRVWLVFPLVALWANVHGSVTLGAALIFLAGLLEICRRQLRGLALAGGALASVFLSPYGFALVHYYRSLLFNPLMGDYVGEWRPSSFPGALPFFVLVVAVAMLVARNWARFTMFEGLALVTTGAAGFMAVRGIVWFLLTAIVIVPKAVDAELPSRRTPSRLIPGLALASVATAILLSFVGIGRLPGQVAAAFPDAAAQVVAREAAVHPKARIYASERFADWLLWTDPALSGRLVSDVRFELFDRADFDRLGAFHARAGAGWKRILDNARIVVLDRKTDGAPARALLAEPHARLRFSNADLAVIDRG